MSEETRPPLPLGALPRYLLRLGALRMLTSALRQEAKLGSDDEVVVLQRERKRRLEAAEAYRQGGSEDRAAAEESEARRASYLELVEPYLVP